MRWTAYKHLRYILNLGRVSYYISSWWEAFCKKHILKYSISQYCCLQLYYKRDLDTGVFL